jgi:hypothetical protein
MKFETTKCNQCGSEMLMGLTVCPSCGKTQATINGGGGSLQPRTLLAVLLAAAVLFAFNWFKSPPQEDALTARPSAALPSK